MLSIYNITNDQLIISPLLLRTKVKFGKKTGTTLYVIPEKTAYRDFPALCPNRNIYSRTYVIMLPATVYRVALTSILHRSEVMPYEESI